MSATAQLNAAIAQAVRAPSIHNSQPWRWRTAPGRIELHADLTRHLPWTDPNRRDLLLSCGAALHHLRAALAAQGFGTDVHRLADPDNEWHLATVLVHPDGADTALAELAEAIPQRRTDRRRMSRQPVPSNLIAQLADLVHREGAQLLGVTDADTRARLDSAISDAAHQQGQAPGYAGELQIWTHRYAGSGDGVAAAQVPVALFGGTTAAPLRSFPEAGLAQPRLATGSGDGTDAAELLVVATNADDYAAWLTAGEALSALLLGATLRGLATTPLSQAVEIATTRDRIRREVLETTANPQILVRVGWPATGAAELPAAARRDVSRVLLHG